MSTRTDLLLVRHPETQANIDGRFVGRGHSPFTDRGQEQVQRLSLEIAAFGPDEVWSSPLERALVPAKRASAASGAPLVVDERLIELDFGAAEGLNVVEIEERGLPFNYRNKFEPVAPGGESRDQIATRSEAVCDELVSRGGRFAIVTHGGVFRSAIVGLLGLDPDAIWAFHVHNAQLAYVRVVDGHGMLEEYRQA